MAASLRSGGKHIASIISSSTKLAELHVSTGTGKPKQLTRLNKEFDGIAIQKPEEIIVKSDDGYPIHAWILKPPDFNPKKKYPSILEIHGGPRAQYGNSFFHEMQYLAAKGYVVYYGNPRGGQGYGRKHAEVIINAWGTVDYDDCMALAYHMAKQPYIDCRKMGVTGGSYGGYMTNWIVTHTNMFAAAVTQRSVVNFISFYGASDIGFALDREIKGNPWDNFDSWWEMSPIKHVANVRTPLLISHSEQDLRCPIEQGEQLYIALKKLGRKVEMIRFPDEPHGLSRCGRPDRRIARLEWIAKWFDKYLKGK
jgi:dipeptidyl aminopeptidase/acylaminoacyl peptidase